MTHLRAYLMAKGDVEERERKKQAREMEREKAKRK